MRMSEALSLDSQPVVKSPRGLTEETTQPGHVTEEDKPNTPMNETATVFDKEPATLPWPEDKSDHPGGMVQEVSDPKLGKGETDMAEEKESVRSDSVSLHRRFSRTESSKELGAWEKQETKEGWVEKEHFGLGEQVEHLEIEVELNSMPEKAAGVFSSTEAMLRSTGMPEPLGQNATCWAEETEGSPFLRCSDTLPKGYSSNTNHMPSCRCTGSKRDVLKMAVAICMAALIFPVLVWGGYTFLPFDAPLLGSAPLRLVYTLRCSVFAVIPVVLGVLVLGVSRLRYTSLKPQCDGEPVIEAVNVHRRYVEDSVSLFLLYFLQLSVMAVYLTQEMLKLVPLLTIIFAFGRLVYWIAAAWGSSVRGFGFGFSFLPMLVMLVTNLYFIFVADSAGSIFADDDLAPLDLLPEKRQRFWG